MAWIMTNPQVHNTFECLGVRNGDSYKVSADCLSILEGILGKLSLEDQTLRTFRRAIGFGENIKKDLIPLLIYVKDDTKINDATKIIDTTIKILVNLTIPVECLLSIDAVSRTDVGRHTIFELNRLLTTSKEAFTDSRSTKAVVDHMKHVVEMDNELNVQQCDSINNCLCLLRNVLHIPENHEKIPNCPLAHTSMQNEIIWNLFTQSIDKIIIYLMSCPQKMYWGVTMVQLIALMYKDQHAGTLQKLLNLWLEASLSESSEDNESNTSPPNQGSGDSSPIITSDPTSDSSDNGGGRKRIERNNSDRNKSHSIDVVRAAQNRSKALASMKRGKSTETEHSSSSGVSSSGQNNESGSSVAGKSPQSIDLNEHASCNEIQTGGKKCLTASSQSEDCGYVTQVENQESISTSSNDDDQPHQKPVHQKPHTFQKTRYNNPKNRSTISMDKKELRRKKLVKRSKTNIINMKGLLHHTPTDEDISNILKEFTVDFLLKGYGSLVQVLYTQLLNNIHVPIDTSHFFWLITYFLKLATQLELDLEHISAALSSDILSYLVFQGVWLYEELEISCQTVEVDLKPCLRRLHLVVTAIREFLQGVEMYSKMGHLSDEDRMVLSELQKKICQTHDLKHLFILLLRQYNPNLQSHQYLQDLVITNHNYLLFLDNSSKINQHLRFNIMDHLKQFATVEIMRQYGILLEDFRENGEFVNNCIFTMMHHIGGDLEHISTLFQPSILKTFSQIWETDYDICDDWADLIEYVIHKFINTPRSNLTYKDDITSVSSSKTDELEWTQEEKDNLLEFYNQSKDANDTIANITRKYEEIGKKSRTREDIIKELLEQTIIDAKQHEKFMEIEKNDKMSLDVRCEDVEQLVVPDYSESTDNDIKVLREYLNKENKASYITWLQNIAIEACFVKIVLTNTEIFKNVTTIMEPSVYYYALLQMPIPVVTWTFEESNALKHQLFVLLLHKLGFYLPIDTGKIFVRIPNFWTADYLFSIAQQLGPIDLNKLKFDISLLQNKKDTLILTNEFGKSSVEHGNYSIIGLQSTPPSLRLTPLPSSSEFDQIPKPLINNELQINTVHNISIHYNQPKPNRSLKTSDCLSAHDMDISPSGSLEILPYDNELKSPYETASVASDLTRMCVSDEDDKTDYIDVKK